MEYAVYIPATPILTLRFPDGDVEYRSTRGELPIGALVCSRGSLWRVRAHTQTGAAILEPAEPPAEGAPGGPVVIPSALADTPLTLEILAEA
jgi:hypothetical protein